MSATPILEPAPAKINLYLHVTGQRSDGYHNLESLVVFAALADTLYVRRGGGRDHLVTLEILGPFAAQVPSGPDNLVIKAADLMVELARAQNAAGLASAQLSLIKRIPTASGLGGGSADAAAAMRALNRFWGLNFPLDKLASAAQTLGADVPMCLYSQALKGSGTGEIISPVSQIPQLAAVLVNPGTGLETPSVFEALESKSNAAAKRLPKNISNRSGLIKYLATCRNDLEAPAITLLPEIMNVIAALRDQPDCLIARMSGSGATCFGLFESMERAHDAATNIRRSRPRLWVRATEFN